MSIGPLILLLIPLCHGFVLLYQGIAGVAVRHDPRCGSCQYDLPRTIGERPTACPACGLSLTDPRAVVFTTRERRPARITSGVLLICVPFVLIIASMPAGSLSGAATTGTPPVAVSTLTIAQLTEHLNDAPPPAWLWPELTARLQDSQITTAELRKIVDTLATWLETDGNRFPEEFVWQRRVFFLEAIDQSHLEPVDLKRIFLIYGATLEVIHADQVSANQQLRIKVRRSDTSSQDLIAEQICMATVAMRIDGVSVPFSDSVLRTTQFNLIRVDLEPFSTLGDHVVELDVTLGIFPANAVPASQVPPMPEAWPSTAYLIQHRTLTSHVLVVEPPETEPDP